MRDGLCSGREINHKYTEISIYLTKVINYPSHINWQIYAAPCPCLLLAILRLSSRSGALYCCSDTPCSSTSANCMATPSLSPLVLRISSADNKELNLATALSTLPALKFRVGALIRAVSRMLPSLCYWAGGTGLELIPLVVPTLAMMRVDWVWLLLLALSASCRYSRVRSPAS